MNERGLAPTAGTASSQRRLWLPLLLIVALFFLWGMANNLNDVLVAQFKKVFTLSDLQAGLVQSAFYLGYFLVAMPAGLFMRRHGYKYAVVLGLLLYGLGALLFWPAANRQSYGFFLLALFVIASGLAFLETSANPFVTVLGPPQTATRRLNLAQAFNPLGSISGIWIGQHYIFSGIEHSPSELAGMTPSARAAYLTLEATSVQLPYLLIGVVVIGWAALIALTRFPAVLTADERAGSVRQGIVGRLLREPSFRFALLAQFCYVGAQVGVWSYMIRYAQASMPGTTDRQAANFLLACLIGFMAGRFVGAGLMKWVRAERLLGWFALLDVALALLAVLQPGMIGACALVVCSFFMSVMYPTIFSLGVESRDDDERKLGSAMLVMTIIGGAVVTAILGAVSDGFGIARAMLVPAAGYAVVWLFARYHMRRTLRGEA